MVSQGLAEIMPDRVMVLTTSAERPEEIDWKRAEAAKEPGPRSVCARS